MEHLSKYPEDYARPLLLLMDILGRVNIKFFNNNASWFERNWRFFYIVPLMACQFISMSVYIVKVFIEGKDVFADAFMIPIYIIHIQTFIKISVIIMNKVKFEKFIDELGQIWRKDNLNDEQKAIKESSAKEMSMAGWVFMQLPLCVAWQYLLMPILETLLRNLILREDDEMRLPFSCSYPFDPNSSWVVYAATYCVQFYCMLSVTYLYLSADFLFITLSAHLSAEFMLLREDLIHVKPTRVVDNDVSHIMYDNGNIRNFVICHQKFIRLAKELNTATNKIMFINLMCTTVNISFFGLAALAARSTVDKIINLAVILTLMILTLILCYFSEKLKSASEEIFDSACRNPWYEGDKEYKRIILFIMIRSQKPCYLTSLYVPITLTTFTTVMSTTWSYFSLMNTMYENKEDTY